MKFQRCFLLWLLLIILLALTLKTYAYCSPSGGWDNRPLMFNFPLKIMVAVDKPIGSVIYETEITEDHNRVTYAMCVGQNARGVKYLNGWVADSNGIAETNVSGVGIRIHWIYDGSVVQVPTDPYAMTWGPVLIWKGGPRWKLELIKIGPISGGTLKTGNYAVYGVGGVLISRLVVAGGGNIVSPGCSVLLSSIYVPLGDHLKSELGSPGKTTSWQPFNIRLICNPETRINVRIDATSEISSVPGVMKLDPQKGDMSATGVGIQLWYNYNEGRPVEFGRETYYKTVQTGGGEVVRFQARYYQTGNRVTAGKADGTAMFTLTYR